MVDKLSFNVVKIILAGIMISESEYTVIKIFNIILPTQRKLALALIPGLSCMHSLPRLCKESKLGKRLLFSCVWGRNKAELNHDCNWLYNNAQVDVYPQADHRRTVHVICIHLTLGQDCRSASQSEQIHLTQVHQPDIPHSLDI